MMEEKVLFGNLTVYRERGNYLRRLEQFDKAKASFDEAYRHAPEDLTLLTGRSQTCADAMLTRQAFEDAQAALKVNPRSMIALNVQARALYTMSNFERSVVMNYRGSRLRSQPPYFKEGINQGLETIQDCIGENAGNVMLDFLPLIKLEESKRPIDDHDGVQRRPKHKCRIPQKENVVRMTQWEKRKHETLARVLAMKYLGPMASDKFFLEALMNDYRVSSANAKGSRELKDLIKATLDSLVDRQDMLRAQRPYYSIKYAEKTESRYLTKYKLDLLVKDRENSARNADRFLKEIDKYLRSNRIADVMIKAERMQAFLDSKTPVVLLDKDLYTERLYRAVGEGYMSMHRLSYRLSERSNRRRIAFLMGLPVGRPKSFDSVMGTYPYKFINEDHAMKAVENKLNMCENNFMRCFLTYELAKLLTKKKNYALAKFYAKKCQQQAHEIDSAPWWLNGCFALMSGDMQQGNQNDVRIAVEEAYEYAKKLKDPDMVRAFLKKCEQMSMEAVPPDELKTIKQREQQILRVVDEVTKVETGVLFKRIATVPQGRRFAVLPRKIDLSKEPPERTRRKQPGLTIVPGKERVLPPPPKSNVLGFQKFDLNSSSR